MKRLSIVAVVVFAFLSVTGWVGQATGQNILTMNVKQEFWTIDPSRATDYTEVLALFNLYDSLVFPDSNGETQPKLAESWTARPDGLSYTFYLKKGVKFHDNTVLTAEDVKFSMDRMLALKSGFSWLWADLIKETTVNDTYTITFHLKEPFGPFVSTLAMLRVVNKDVVLAHKAEGQYGEFGDYGAQWFSITTTEDAGSGPYKLKDWDRGSVIVFERSPDYLRAGRKVINRWMKSISCC